MSRPELPMSLQGGCHCGRVRYQLTLRSWRLAVCNCSICTKKGYQHLIVPAEDFSLLSGEQELSTYTFNTHAAQHHFCRHCGIHSFYVPRSHPDGFSVNARCVDGADPSWFEVTAFDGQHWEAHVASLR